ncbi:MAG: exopolysaccharide biosynthesis polyprenyl glycosylphosphotransferase [Candidatus Paceibacterota bacterium]
MALGEKIRKIILAIGDLVCFYLSLFLMATIRHLNADYFSIHLKLFSIIFIVWLVVFYIGHLYELENFKDRKKLFNLICRLQIINIVLAIIIFYLYPVITPKTNLALIIIFSSLFILLWRYLATPIFLKKIAYRTLLLGNSKEIEEINKLLSESSVMGYQLVKWIDNPAQFQENELKNLVEKEKIRIIVIDDLLKDGAKKGALQKFVIEEMFQQKEIYDTIEFYEMVFKRIPLSAVDENWFLNYLKVYRQNHFFSTKRIFDFVAALIIFLISLIFWPFIVLAIKIDSPGPIFYSSWRVGQNGRLFKIYKFRSMYALPEDENWPRWANQNDSRITRTGKFLRKTHLDELPQLINILKGDMSFVGPRPIEKKLFDLCIQEKPIYYLRNIVKPGLVGWAQLNYPYAASLEDELKKFEYDLYYLRNRSFWFDIAIIARTIKILLSF